MKKAISIFKHIFIPHIHNDYKPHLFREASVTAILIAVIILFSVSVSSKLIIKNSDMMSAVLPAVLVDLANKDRISVGESALTRNSLLDQAAQLKAEDMATHGYFAHTSPEGFTPWYWFNKVGYLFSYAGENLAIDFNESEDVENAWLNSPKHRENITSNRFTEIGIATVEGYYNGSPTIYVVQMFGSPAFVSTKEVNPTATPIIPTTKPKVVEPKIVPTKVATIPVVRGESVTSPVKVVEEQLETISVTDNFIEVKNTAITEEVIPQAPKENIQYSTWQERLAFSIPKYTDSTYKIIFWIILLGLMIMTAYEISRKHVKNISYGALLIVIIFCFIYINKIMFVTSLIS